MEASQIKLWMLITAVFVSIQTIQGISLRLRNALLSSGDWLNDVDGDNIPGRAGMDYPIYSSVPENTSFRCRNYDYAGYFADIEADCQAYHVCFPDGRNASFLCVNGTVFHQRYYVCDWWFHSNCSLAPGLYELNLYRKIPLPVLPPVRRRPFQVPAPQPQVQLPPKLREAKQIDDKPNTDRKESDKKMEKKKLLPPAELVNKKPLLQTRKEDTCDCQCNNAIFHNTA